MHTSVFVQDMYKSKAALIDDLLTDDCLFVIHLHNSHDMDPLETSSVNKQDKMDMHAVVIF